MSDELITLRNALIILKKPHLKEDVRSLRRKLQRRELKKGVRILTPEPYRVTMTQLREHAPELFVDVEEIAIKKLASRITKAIRLTSEAR